MFKEARESYDCDGFLLYHKKRLQSSSLVPFGLSE